MSERQLIHTLDGMPCPVPHCLDTVVTRRTADDGNCVGLCAQHASVVDAVVQGRKIEAVILRRQEQAAAAARVQQAYRMNIGYGSSGSTTTTGVYWQFR
jgi:hypothetical protein